MFSAIREEYRVHGRLVRHTGFWTILVYRFGVWAQRRRLPMFRWGLGKVYGLCSFVVSVISGVHLDRAAKIGKRFRILHAGGIYISNRVEIGDDVTVMHHVTVGSDPLGRAPIIRDGVFIGPGACVVGHVEVGTGSRIGPNAVVIQDVPENTIVMAPPPTQMPNLSPSIDVVKKNRDHLTGDRG